MTAVNEYIKDVRVEMSKVSWPTRAELRESTVVVIVMVFLVAILIGVIDRGLSIAFEALLKLLG
jgi:preprotein translocase subunit SecE